MMFGDHFVMLTEEQEGKTQTYPLLSKWNWFEQTYTDIIHCETSIGLNPLILSTFEQKWLRFDLHTGQLSAKQ